MPLVQWLLEGTRDSGATRRDMAEQFDEYYLALPYSYMMSDHRCKRKIRA
jgi:hypothetical protein